MTSQPREQIVAIYILRNIPRSKCNSDNERWSINKKYNVKKVFCSNVVLVWTFHTAGVYNVITKRGKIPVNLVPFFNSVSFLFCCFLKSGETNVCLVSICIEDHYSYIFFLKKGGIYELGSHSIQFALFMEMAGYGTCFSFNITLCI